MAESTDSVIVNCCYVCEQRMPLVTNNRCCCKLDKKYRAVFARCSKFKVTTDKDIMSIAMKLCKPMDRWYT